MPRTGIDELWRLLPPNATAFEKDVLGCAPFDNILDPIIPGINTAKLITLPDSWLPWLVVEYGIAELAQFISDPRELISEGLIFNRRRGTAAAVIQAMGWMGFDVSVIEADRPGIHFAEYQIDLGTVPNSNLTLYDILTAARIAAPIRSRLRRVFHGWDFRQFYLDETRLGYGLLDSFSGVALDSLNLRPGTVTGLIASFGRTIDYSIPGNAGIVVGDYHEKENLYDSLLRPHPWPILDVDFDGEFFYPNDNKVYLSHTHDELADDLLDENGEPLTDENGDSLTIV